jgi:hypothetical protein
VTDPFVSHETNPQDVFHNTSNEFFTSSGRPEFANIEPSSTYFMLGEEESLASLLETEYVPSIDLDSDYYNRNAFDPRHSTFVSQPQYGRKLICSLLSWQRLT